MRLTEKGVIKCVSCSIGDKWIMIKMSTGFIRRQYVLGKNRFKETVGVKDRKRGLKADGEMRKCRLLSQCSLTEQRERG